MRLEFIAEVEPAGQPRPTFRCVGNIPQAYKASSSPGVRKCDVMKSAIREAAYKAMDLDGIQLEPVRPITVAITAAFSRPKSHMGTGRNEGIVKASSPHHHVVKPDADNVAKAVLDALSGIVYRDDVQVVFLAVSKCYAAPSEGPRVTVVVEAH